MKYAVAIIGLVYAVVITYTMRDYPYNMEYLVNTTVFTLIIPVLVCYLIRHICMWFSIMYIRRNL